MGPCCIWARTFVLAASSQEVAMGSWEAGPGVLDCGLPFLWSSLLPICTEWRQVLAAYWRPWPGLLKAGHNGLPRLDPLLAILQQDTEQALKIVLQPCPHSAWKSFSFELGHFSCCILFSTFFHWAVKLHITNHLLIIKFDDQNKIRNHLSNDSLDRAWALSKNHHNLKGNSCKKRMKEKLANWLTIVA